MNSNALKIKKIFLVIQITMAALMLLFMFFSSEWGIFIAIRVMFVIAFVSSVISLVQTKKAGQPMASEKGTVAAGAVSFVLILIDFILLISDAGYDFRGFWYVVGMLSARILPTSFIAMVVFGIMELRKCPKAAVNNSAPQQYGMYGNVQPMSNAMNTNTQPMDNAMNTNTQPMNNGMYAEPSPQPAADNNQNNSATN